MRSDDQHGDPQPPSGGVLSAASIPHSAFRTPHSKLPPLFVLSGPSGAGKSTVVDEVLKACRFPLRRAVTATTRDPRPAWMERLPSSTGGRVALIGGGVAVGTLLLVAAMSLIGLFL